MIFKAVVSVLSTVGTLSKPRLVPVLVFTQDSGNLCLEKAELKHQNGKNAAKKS